MDTSSESVSAFQVIPVLDLMNGHVVRGVAGERGNYRPVESVLTESSDAVDVAQAIHEEFRLRQFYVADLDAILGTGSHQVTVNELIDAGFAVMLDAGINNVDSASQWTNSNVQLVIGLETLRSWDDLQQLVNRCPDQEVVFSLDLKSENPLGALGNQLTAQELFQQAWNCGVREFILLDLAGVGVAAGIPTLPLCRELRHAYPDATLITGGGVRTADDIAAAQRSGANGVLIASALHNGQVSKADLAAC
ncbi:MAG: HisA/HisF-related TIM barrel protein [Planctomycetaceae bacterium]